MADELRAIQALPILSWRGLEHQWYDDASAEWSLGQAKRQFPYVNGAHHESTGLSEDTLPVRLYFLNSLETGLFPDVWNEWLKELRDPEPGDLVHPLLGKVNAVIQSVKVTLNAQSTAGVVADIVWSTDIKDPEEANELQPIKANLTALSVKAGQSSSEAGIFLPDEAPVTDITDGPAMIDGLVASAEADVVGAINGMTSAVAGMVEIAERRMLAGETGVTQAHDDLVALWGAYKDLGEDPPTRDRARQKGTAVLETDTPLSAFADSVGNTLEDVISLNLFALATPTVPRGTELQFYL